MDPQNQQPRTSPQPMRPGAPRPAQPARRQAAIGAEVRSAPLHPTPASAASAATPPAQPTAQLPPPNHVSSPSVPVEPKEKPTLSEPHVAEPSKRETAREVISTIGVLLAALLVAFALIAWVFQSYEVEGPSMMNTLQNQDRLIVWKVPRTIARITGKDYIPHRKDIIIFTESNLSEFGQSAEKQLIKRVIGLPGERVVLKDGVLKIYNDQNPDGFEPDKDGSYRTISSPPDIHDIDITLTANQIFVCGDNRPDSLDSRTFGPINADQIVGKLSLRLLPLSGLQKF